MTLENEKIMPLILQDNMEIELDETEPYKNYHSLKDKSKDESFSKIKIDLAAID